MASKKFAYWWHLRIGGPRVMGASRTIIGDLYARDLCALSTRSAKSLARLKAAIMLTISMQQHHFRYATMKTLSSWPQ
jgi:hypothetical protein